MRKPIAAMTLLLLAVCILAAQVESAAPTDPIRLRNLDRYVRITDKPFKMHDSTIAFCRPPELVALNPHEPAGPKAAYCHVYVNDVARETIVSGKGTYPEGSIVIKSKLNSIDAKQPELFTAMKKMPAGYDADRGDWQYFVFDGPTYRQVAAGRIDSCIDCHESYQETDYITRLYLPKPKPVGKPGNRK